LSRLKELVKAGSGSASKFRKASAAGLRVESARPVRMKGILENLFLDRACPEVLDLLTYLEMEMLAPKHF
jgi:hypothetical protein